MATKPKLNLAPTLYALDDTEVAVIAYAYLERLSERVSITAIAEATRITRTTLHKWFRVDYSEMSRAVAAMFILTCETHPAIRSHLEESEPASYPQRRSIAAEQE